MSILVLLGLLLELSVTPNLLQQVLTSVRFLLKASLQPRRPPPTATLRQRANPLHRCPATACARQPPASTRLQSGSRPTRMSEMPEARTGVNRVYTNKAHCQMRLGRAISPALRRISCAAPRIDSLPQQSFDAPEVGARTHASLARSRVACVVWDLGFGHFERLSWRLTWWYFPSVSVIESLVSDIFSAALTCTSTPGSSRSW
eukprot:2753315-Rhodomonas_salina.5